MAAFERTGPLQLERQLDGSASQSVDCGVAACVMALDDASYGLIRPSTEAVRKRMGNDRDATNPDQWKAAIDSYADRFTAMGLQPPRTADVRGKGHDELWRLLHGRRRRVIAAIHYGTVAREKRALCLTEVTDGQGTTLSSSTYDALDCLRDVTSAGTTIHHRHVGSTTQVSQYYDVTTSANVRKCVKTWGGGTIARFATGSMPRSRATARTERPDSRTSRTASSRYSGLYGDLPIWTPSCSNCCSA